MCGNSKGAFHPSPQGWGQNAHIKAGKKTPTQTGGENTFVCIENPPQAYPLFWKSSTWRSGREQEESIVPFVFPASNLCVQHPTVREVEGGAATRQYKRGMTKKI